MTAAKKKQLIGLFAGTLTAVVVWRLPLAMPWEGQKCLALSLMTVVFWAWKAMDTGMISLTLLVSYVLFLDAEIVPPAAVFRLWTSPAMYLVIGGFLIAEAVKSSGLGERMAFYFIKKFVRSYDSVIICCYLLGFILSFVIPHPWPRSFLLISIMSHVIAAANLEPEYAANIGLAVFAGSIPTAMILITGDSTLNPVVASMAGVSISWLQWFLYLGIPGILASLLTCILQLKLFGKPKDFSLTDKTVDKHIAKMGGIGKKEMITIVVMLLAVVLWMTESVHGVHPGWIAIGTAIIFNLPFVRVLEGKFWSAINMGTLFFLCAALSIGSIGNITGMNAWIADSLLPTQILVNPYLFSLIACIICMVIHMILGSTLAVLGIATPAIISFGALAGVSPLVASMTAYTAVTLHWLLPFHHMSILVGLGENGGNYTEKEVLELGIPQTFVVIMICLFEILWWSWIGLIK